MRQVPRREEGPQRGYIERIIRDKDPVDKGLALAEKLKEMTGYPQNPDYQSYLAQLYVLKEDPAKVDEAYGKDFADDYVSTAIFALNGYANFWIEQGRNLESAEEMADIMAAAIGAAKDVPPYMCGQVAGLYTKLKKTDKALAVYGPGFAEKCRDDQSALASYASFWNRQGTNLESALGAAKRSVELTSDYYNNFTLARSCSS